MTGKDSIAIRFSRDTFSPVYIPTIGVDFFVRYIKILGVMCKVNTWTLSGQRRFATVVQSYFNGANGVMLVFDITNSQSFEDVRFWLDMGMKYTDCCKQLIGAKKDKEQERQVSLELAKKFAAENGMEYIEVSSSDGTNVEEAFLQLLCNAHLKMTQINLTV